jgi:hypothetical protein
MAVRKRYRVAPSPSDRVSRQLRLDILTRVSRTMGREGDSYGSPETQLKDCRGWIARRATCEGEHFHEENVSGGALLASRPGLQAVIERMRAGESDGVVVRAYDRFMRSVALSWEVIELIEGRDGHGGIGRPVRRAGQRGLPDADGADAVHAAAVRWRSTSGERALRVGRRADTGVGARRVARAAACRAT